jgi:broad specificity phosphatase PhoE
MKFDVVVSSPYRRCMETAVRICQELQVPLAIDERIGEVQNTSVMGETLHEEVERFHRSIADNTKFAETHGVEVISIEDICGTTSSNDLPRWQESVQKAFTRYAKAFEIFASSGKSILCVTHGMGLVSITHKFCDDFQTTNPDMGDFFVCDVSSPTAASQRHRPKYSVITHSSANHSEKAVKSNFKRSTSCPSVDSLATLVNAPRRPSIQTSMPLEAVQESSCSNRGSLSVRRGKRLSSCLPQKRATVE